MKKMFTLFAALMAAMTMNAKFVLTGFNFNLPEDGVVSAWSWNQQATNDSQSHQDETTGEWITDKEATYDYKDASAYDFIVVQFEENTCGARFFCVNGDWSKQVETEFVANASYVAVDLNESEVAEFKDNIAAFVMMPIADGVLKIKEMAYMSAKEFEDLKNGVESQEITLELKLPGVDGVIEMAGKDEAGWYSPGWNGLKNLDSLYKTLVFEVASAEEHFHIMVQGSVDGGESWGDEGFTTFEVDKLTEPAVVALPVEGKHCHLGQFAFQNMYVVDEYEYMDPSTGELVKEAEYGDNKVVVTRIYLTNQVVESNYPEWVDPAGITNISVEQTNAMFNIAGQRVNANAKGIIIQNGRKFIIK